MPGRSDHTDDPKGNESHMIIGASRVAIMTERLHTTAEEFTARGGGVLR